MQDSQDVAELLHDSNTYRELWADFAYRSRIENLFAVQSRRAENLLLRGVDLTRKVASLGWHNRVSNLDRYGTLDLA